MPSRESAWPRSVAEHDGGDGVFEILDEVPLPVPLANAAAALLPDGRVIVVGGLLSSTQASASVKRAAR